MSVNEVCVIVEVKEILQLNTKNIEYHYYPQFGLIDKFIYSEKNRQVALTRIQKKSDKQSCIEVTIRLLDTVGLDPYHIQTRKDTDG